MSNNDIFGTRCFIENKGQYNKVAGISSTILFAYETSNTIIYFTESGPVYSFFKINELSAKQQKLMEKGFPLPVKPNEECKLFVNFKDPSSQKTVVAESRTKHYFTYGNASLNAYGFKKIVYKNVFDNIDIEYLISDERTDAIKYNLILKKGANPEDIKMVYSGDIKALLINEKGELEVNTSVHNIKETLPVTYYNQSKKSIGSKFKLKSNCLSFALGKYDNEQEVTIDPWITNLTTVGTGFDVDYDLAGNLYVIGGGGGPPYKLAKYSASGALQWTFFAQVASINWPLFRATNFVVNKVTGKTYIGELANYQSGVTIIRVDGSGNYDFSSIPIVNLNECWELAYRCSDAAICPMGGHNYSSVSTLDEVTGNLTPTYFHSSVSDVNNAVFDDAGNLFLHRTDNLLQKINPALTNQLWISSTNFPTFTYLSHKFGFVGGGAPQGFNCIAVNNSFLYYYDGYNLAAYNKANGIMIASTTIPGYNLANQAGIDVDNCNNLYLGGNNGDILRYHFNGSSFTTLGIINLNPTTPSKFIYDLKLNYLANSLYYSGTGFTGIHSLTTSTCILSNICMSIPSTSTVLCNGSTAILAINTLNYLTNPTFSLQPGNITSSSSLIPVSPSVTTVYTVYITGLNSQNTIQTMTTTATASVIPSPVISPTVINGTCANPVTSSVNLNITFSPTGSPNYTTTWSPMPGTVTTVNSGTASGLIPGINNVTVTTSAGCKSTASFSVPPVPLPASFVLVNPSNDYTLTCLNTNVLITTSVTNGVPLTFTWFPSCTGSVVGTSMNFNQPCVGQVIGTSSTGCQMIQTFTVFQNYTSPNIAITPTVSNITCAGGSGCFTLTSNLGPNVTTNWFQIQGTNTVYVGAAQGTINIFCAGAPGDYWGESVNNLTGCKSTKSVQVTASVGVPIFTITSPTNFTIGCGSKSITSMQVTTVITSPVPNVAVNYTFMVPPVTGTPTTFSINPNLNNITIPGTYVIYVKDMTNNCVSSQSVSIIQNTIAPNIDLIQPLSILSCRDPSMVLNGLSSNPNTQITWTGPAIPSNSINPTPDHTVVINPAITGATNNITSVGIFTVGAVDQNNMCGSTKTIQILQDVRIPRFTISALTNSVITCKNLDVVIVPIITPTLAVALVPTYVWFPPVGGGVPGSQFNSTAAGSHTAISTSVVNGCTASATYIIATDQIPPALITAGLFTLDCATNPTTVLTPSITGSTSGLTYSWAVQPGALTSNLTSSALTTNMPGLYAILVTNTLNGCSSAASYEVIRGSIKADFVASPSGGFAPLLVTFNNTSSTSTGASSIISTWGYGNGAVTQTVYNTSQVSTTYTAPGIYSVYLKVQKGICVDQILKTIIVELPSKLEVPNVFTPNGDKANDIFRLIATNLREINIVIFDRWGNKVYELTSDTGNFAWNGKNQLGKDCAEGTYFYIIKASGKDGQEYDAKGNVSLFR